MNQRLRQGAVRLGKARDVYPIEKEVIAVAKKVMKLINEYTGEMECKVCGSRHLASIKPHSNGHYYRGSWQCVHKCKLD